MKIELSNSKAVDEHIQNIEPELQPVVSYLRKIILNCDPIIGERIKWNNPSFFYSGEMPNYDPKSYKKELAVFNLHKGRIMLVFTSGAKINDPSGILKGDFKDGRRIITFTDLNHAKQQTEALQAAIKDWLKKVND